MPFRSSLAFLAALVAGVALPACDGTTETPVDAAPDAADAGVPDADPPDPCSACHGSAASPAPPPDLAGSTSRDAAGVGAHGAHLTNTNDHAEIHCRHCHPVPETVDAPGHVDAERPADVALTGLATFGGDASREPDGSCRVSCHGSFLRVDPGPSPPWTSSEEGPLGCESCHGLPPAAPHPAASDCGRCHLEVADLEARIVHPTLHVDGFLQAPHHAHLIHLGGAGGPTHACTDCHVGDDYHGPLRDGLFLDDTAICADCHTAGEATPEAWRTYEWP